MKKLDSLAFLSEIRSLCRDPGTVDNAERSPAYSSLKLYFFVVNFREDDTVTFTCNDGYHGGGTITCLNNSLWTPKPTCNPQD